MIATSNAPTKAAVNVATEKPLMRVPKYQKTAPFITRENNPRVTIFIGRVSIFMIGLMNILNKVKHAPTIRTIYNGSIIMPSIIFDVAKTETERIIQCKIIFIIKNKIKRIIYLQFP